MNNSAGEKLEQDASSLSRANHRIIRSLRFLNKWQAFGNDPAMGKDKSLSELKKLEENKSEREKQTSKAGKEDGKPEAVGQTATAEGP